MVTRRQFVGTLGAGMTALGAQTGPKEATQRGYQALFPGNRTAARSGEGMQPFAATAALTDLTGRVNFYASNAGNAPLRVLVAGYSTGPLTSIPYDLTASKGAPIEFRLQGSQPSTVEVGYAVVISDLGTRLVVPHLAVGGTGITYETTITVYTQNDELLVDAKFVPKDRDGTVIDDVGVQGVKHLATSFLVKNNYQGKRTGIAVVNANTETRYVVYSYAADDGRTAHHVRSFAPDDHFAVFLDELPELQALRGTKGIGQVSGNLDLIALEMDGTTIGSIRAGHGSLPIPYELGQLKGSIHGRSVTSRDGATITLKGTQGEHTFVPKTDGVYGPETTSGLLPTFTGGNNLRSIDAPGTTDPASTAYWPEDRRLITTHAPEVILLPDKSLINVPFLRYVAFGNNSGMDVSQNWRIAFTDENGVSLSLGEVRRMDDIATNFAAYDMPLFARRRGNMHFKADYAFGPTTIQNFDPYTLVIRKVPADDTTYMPVTQPWGVAATYDPISGHANSAIIVFRSPASGILMTELLIVKGMDDNEVATAVANGTVQIKGINSALTDNAARSVTTFDHNQDIYLTDIESGKNGARFSDDNRVIRPTR